MRLIRGFVGSNPLPLLAGLLLATQALADDTDLLAFTANELFADLPEAEVVNEITGNCGATSEVNQQVVYCATENRVYITYDAAGSAAGPYLLAHVLGHAVQVRHGVADVALRTIIQNRDRETELRQDVTRMVECIAGVLIARAGVPATPLPDLFDEEPFTDSHWGRDPLEVGPQVTLGMEERNAWYQRGIAAGHPDVCGTTSFPADLVVDAFRG